MSSRFLRRRPERSYSSSSSESSTSDIIGDQGGVYSIGRGYISNRPSTPTSRGPPVPGDNNPGRWVYRGSDTERAQAYVATGDTQFIATRLPGDFHLGQNEPTAYFTTRERYAHHLARERHGLVIQQRVPPDILNGSRSYYFDPEPTPDWRTVVLANREERLLGRDDGDLRRIQRLPVISGPTADVSSRTLSARARRYPSESQPFQDSFRPVISSSSDSDSDIEPERRRRTYSQQIAIRGEALERLAQEPRYARRPHRVHYRRRSER